jgi:hypothetical protein
MCIKLLEWFNNDFLFIFESNTFKNCNKYKESNRDKLHHNIKIIIDEPKISNLKIPNESNESNESNELNESNEPNESNESINIGISTDKYDLYTWDIL